MRYFEVASRLINQEPNEDIPGYGLGLRHIQILLQFSLATIFVAMNMLLPIAIVAMATTADVGTSTAFPNWNDQSLILVSTQCGYAVTQLFGIIICKTYGYHFVMSFSMFICSIFCILIPVLTNNYQAQGLIICLVIQGASQGFSLPVIPEFLQKWIPNSERNAVGILMYAANALGAGVATKMASWMSTSFLGWSVPFYIFGGIGLIWTYLMLSFGRDSPENCENISAEEREFIKNGTKLKFKVPWSKIFNSPSILAIWAAHAGTFWTIWLITAEIPTFISKVLKFPLHEDGDIVSDAYFMSWLFSFIMSGATDYLIRSKILTLSITRKIAQSIASFLAAICMIVLGFISDPHWVIFFLTSIFVALTASFWGFMLSYNDLLKNRGFIISIGNFIATLTTIFPALLTQFIVTDQSDRTQWAIIFWISAGVLLLSNTAFFFYSFGNIEDLDFFEKNSQGDDVLQVDESQNLMDRARTSRNFQD